ncbi:MAG TPA: hypothetical protein VJY15_20275 [Candidatus Acidoferrum sp.]|nr:hypothetical protein [Candidatus Acidoferrum sp.]
MNMPKRTDIQKSSIIGFGPAAIGIAGLLAFLLYASFASSMCIEVMPLPSSRNVRITASVKGEPLQGTKVEIFQTGASFYTDDHGVAMLPPLKPGFYSLVAASGRDLFANLYLTVMQNSESEVSVFSMNLRRAAIAQMPTTAPSSRNVRITAYVNGEPLQGTEVEVFQREKEPLGSLSTDDHGVAVLPPLKPGFYSIVAASGEDLVANLYLHVMENAESEVSVFSMDLQPTATAQMLATAAKMPVTERIQEFKGVAEDPSGAGVPGASIEVYPRGSEAKSKRIQLKADENGHFSAPLADGIYTVVVRMQAFRDSFLVFEVTQDGKAKELRVSLRVGGCP